ncbi:hypothetical protein FRB99_008205 [Tulasnella sp. 403]|nr:hypothetical protein FRB99_008205 [Tulasnella sp. 403]
MTKPVHKVVYKPDSQSTDEYIAIVNPEEYKKWKEGDTSIAIALVVESYDIYHSGQGAQGKLGKVSKQQLHNVFGTEKDDEAMSTLLQRGVLQASDKIGKSLGDTNIARGSAPITSKGAVEGGR